MKLFGKKIFKGNTLYYPGCLTKFAAKEILEKYKKILQREGIDFVMLGDKEVCCGSPVKNAGAEEQFKKLAQKNLEIFKEHGVGRIITNCPACALVFKKDYKEVLGEKWDIETLHFTQLSSKFKMQNAKSGKKKGVVTYHDPCHLGRAMGIYEEPRKMIRDAGFEIDEMELSNFKSFCCGGGGGVKTNDGELSNRVAQDRIEQAKKTKAKTIVTPCPMCWAHLKASSKEEDIEVIELSEIL